MTDESEAEIQESQEQLGKTIERANKGEDRNLTWLVFVIWEKDWFELCMVFSR